MSKNLTQFVVVINFTTSYISLPYPIGAHATTEELWKLMFDEAYMEIPPDIFRVSSDTFRLNYNKSENLYSYSPFPNGGGGVLETKKIVFLVVRFGKPKKFFDFKINTSDSVRTSLFAAWVKSAQAKSILLAGAAVATVGTVHVLNQKVNTKDTYSM